MFQIVTAICGCLVSVKTWLMAKRHRSTKNVSSTRRVPNESFNSYYRWVTLLANLYFQLATMGMCSICNNYYPCLSLFEKQSLCYLVPVILRLTNVVFMWHKKSEKFSGGNIFNVRNQNWLNWLHWDSLNCKHIFQYANLVNTDQNFWNCNYTWKSSTYGHHIYRT